MFLIFARKLSLAKSWLLNIENKILPTKEQAFKGLFLSHCIVQSINRAIKELLLRGDQGDLLLVIVSIGDNYN